MKRFMDTTTTPPNAKRSFSPQIDTLLTQIDSLSTSTIALLNDEGASDVVKQHFSILMTILGTCKAVVDEVRNNATIDSAEEKERRRSLVFMGLPESNNERPSARVQQDQCQVSGILDDLGVEAVPTTVYRMGRPDPNRSWPRPIKVILPASVHQHIALGGWKKHRDYIKTKPNFERLLIRPSLSREQLQQEYEQRKAKRMQKFNPPNMNTVAEHLQQLGEQMRTNQNQNFS